jgi:hypothetical protein
MAAFGFQLWRPEISATELTPAAGIAYEEMTRPV